MNLPAAPTFNYGRDILAASAIGSSTAVGSMGNITAGGDVIIGGQKSSALNATPIGPLFLTFDPSDSQCIRVDGYTAREYRVKLTNRTGATATNVYVEIERTTPELRNYIGTHLDRIHGHSHDLPKDTSDYFCLVEYNPVDPTNAGIPTLHICHTAGALQRFVAIENYTFFLRAHSNEASCDTVAFRFEQLFNRDSRSVPLAGGTDQESAQPAQTARGGVQARIPHLEISNGSNIILPGWKHVPVGAVTITNTARKIETVARTVRANVTFKQDEKGFTINGMEWWLYKMGTTEATCHRSPDISSMSDYTFILPLFFVADHRHYRAWYGSGPEKSFPPYALALGEWRMEVNLEASDGLKWRQILTVLLTNNAEPKW